MKKIFIILSFLLLSSNVYADLKDYFNPTNPYVKVSISGSKLNSTTEKTHSLNHIGKQESKLSPSIGLGIGYVLSPSSRIELSLLMHQPAFEVSPQELKYRDRRTQHIGSITHQRKASVNSLMASYYLTVYQKEDYDVFVGGGVGVAKIKERLNTGTHITHVNAGYRPPLLNVLHNADTASTKDKNNFAYALSAGTSIRLQENVKLEIVYNWRDFGKTHPVDTNAVGEKVPTKNRYRGHDISAGLKFDI